MIEQRSEEWFEARRGKATASRIADIVAKTKSGYSASRANYKAQLVSERLTGEVAQRYQSASMLWGVEHEDEAVAAYEFFLDCVTEEAEFIDHPEIAMSGASPDRLVGEDGLIEIKCPNTATHIDTLLTGKVESKYVKQMTWQLACTKREWCDFVSYDPRMPAEMQLFISRFMPAPEEIKELEKEVRDFLDEVSRTVSILRSKYGLERAA